ncbi:hypothetical protein U9M48_007043 [Paspalum notatum var. saurae]|uniref:Uncharacterized protein n=1 Tax=Paspalum notatum var. saurae TaxID=547442 RepID=A0AAQ3SGQ0_PASNO
MGSDAGLGARKRLVAGVNGLAKEAVNGVVSKEEDQAAAAPPRLLTLPTVLTIGRVAAVPLLMSTFYMEGPWAATATTGIFLAAAVTDWLDGYIARKMQLGTPFGAFLDPVADKLMVAATLVLLCTKPLETSLLGNGPWLLTVPSIAIIGREITMSAVREWAASQNGKVLEVPLYPLLLFYSVALIKSSTAKKFQLATIGCCSQQLREVEDSDTDDSIDSSSCQQRPKPTCSRCSSYLRCCSTLRIRRTCHMVPSGVHEKYMADTSKIALA